MAKLSLASAVDPAAEQELQTLNRRLSEFYNTPAMKRYYDTANQANALWQQDFYHNLLRHLARPNMSVLDLGCGSGHACDNLMDKGVSYTGFDWSREQVEKNSAKSSAGARFVAGSLYDTALPSMSFDMTFSLFVLEHLAWPQKMLHEMFRITRPGGWMVIICPEFRERGRIPSFRYGRRILPIKEKIRRGMWIDAVRHLYARNFHYPRILKRFFPLKSHHFLINTDPSCLDGDYYVDNDAVYLVERGEVVNELVSMGAEDHTALVAKQANMPWPAPDGLCVVVARKNLA